MHVTYSESQLIVFPKTTSLLPLVFQKLNLWPFPSLVSCTSLYIRATFCSLPHSFTTQKSYLSTTLRLFCSVILKQDMSSSGIRAWSGGGLERPGHMQVEPCFKISSTPSQNPFWLILSG